MKNFWILIICIITGSTVVSAQSIADRVNSRDFPSVFQSWNPAENLNESSAMLLSRHDIYWHNPALFGLRVNNTHEGIANGYTAESIEDGLAYKAELLRNNPNQILLAEIRYRDAYEGFLPGRDHEYWMRDANGNLVFGWEEGGYIRLDMNNPEFQDLLAARAGQAVTSGVADGIMFDWWTEGEFLEARIEILRKVRAAIGDEGLILVNSNHRMSPESAPYINGSYMETNYNVTVSRWEEYVNTLQWSEQNLLEPQINCFETWYVTSRDDLYLMRATTTLTLTNSNGYTLFGDPNHLPTADHAHDWYDFWDADLGTPTAPGFRRSDNAYQRSFTNGVAVYNPPGNGTITVNFDNNVTSTATGIVAQTHTINALDGDIFIGEVSNPEPENWSIQNFSAPLEVVPGETYTINIPYTGSGAADMIFMLQNEDENWAAEGFVRALINNSGTVTLTVTVNADAPPGNNYVWHAFITPVGGNYDSRYDSRVIDNVRCTDSIDPEPSAFTVQDFYPPTSVVPGQTYTVNVPYTGTGVARMNLTFQNRDENWITEGFASGTTNNSGTITLTVTVQADAQPGDNYIWQAYLTPVDGDWNNQYDVKSVGNITCTNSIEPAPFTVQDFTAPTNVTPGQSYTINVPYTGSGAADMLLFLQNEDENWAAEGSVRASINNSGTVTLTVTVNANAPAGNNYIWHALITPVGGNYDNRYDNRIIDNVSCTIVSMPGGTIYEAEAATLTGVTTANSNYTNISNGEYVTGFSDDGDQIVFNNIQAPSSGTYTLTIRYACSSYKENYVSVNGGGNQNITFPASTIFTDKTIQVNLNEGNNSITIAKHWGWFDIDYIEIGGTGIDEPEPPQPGVSTKFEAESGVPTGVNTESNSSASAGEYVTGFDNDGDKITVTINVENAGTYQLKVGYRSTSGDKKNDIYLNGMFLGNIQFLQSNSFTEMIVGDFYFDSGQNTIEYIKSWGWMDVDYFEVVAADNQNGNSFNDVCNREVEIGNPPTANYYRAGTINSDATISENRSIQFIGTEAVNLKDGFTVEKGGEFTTGIEGCE